MAFKHTVTVVTQRHLPGFGWLIATMAMALSQPGQAAAQQGGATELASTIAGLGTTARVLMIGAHPDDEDTYLLAFLARGRSVQSAYLSLTRGDGGQNRIGNELGEGLGAIRTEELLAARRIDGAHQFFTRAYDFGFSKNAEETFKHWPRDSILRDVITVIRSFRPHIIVAVFTGTRSDGHGHHEVSGILAREAFDASGDAARYPPSTSGGLAAWAPLKLYRTQRTSANGATVGYNVGEYHPIIGRSLGEVAGESRSQHKSQGFGSLEPTGARMGYLRLERSRVSGTTVPATEASMFDGIDTTWNRFRALNRASSAVDSLIAAARDVRSLYNAFDPTVIIPALGRVEAALQRLCPIQGNSRCELPSDTTSLMRDLSSSRLHLLEKVHAAIILASGISVEARAPRELLALGHSARVNVTVHNRNRVPIQILARQLLIGPGMLLDMNPPVSIQPDSAFRVVLEARDLRGELGPWWLETPRRGDIFSVPISGGRQLSALGPGVPAEDRRGSPLAAQVTFSISGVQGRITTPVTFRFADAVQGEVERVARLTPAVSLRLDRSVEFAKSGSTYDRTIEVSVTSAADNPQQVSLSLQLPRGLTSDSSSRTISLQPHSVRAVSFRVRGQLEPGRHSITATAISNGERYERGFSLIDYPHVRPQRIYQPASLATQAIDVVIPPSMKVAYIPGVGDNVAPVLARMGVSITIVPPASAAAFDYSGYTAVVVGPRAYDANPELVSANTKLFEFVRGGGTMVVQYGQNMGRAGVMPFPIGQPGGADRVTEENAGVKVLDASSPLLNSPNRISAADFEGWVQERSLYMATRSRDPQYKALLEMSDTGEQPHDGALLVAQMGRGRYIYCALALFRQIPAGVPGAARLFVNLMSH